MATKKASNKPTGKQAAKTATKSQKPQAPKESEKKTEVTGKISITARIDKLIDKPDSNLKAIASINLGEGFAVHGFKIMDSQNGLFISMPNTSYTDGGGNTKYNDTFHPITKESREDLIHAIKTEYEQALERKQSAKQNNKQEEEEQEGEDIEPETETEIPFEGPVPIIALSQLTIDKSIGTLLIKLLIKPCRSSCIPVCFFGNP